MIGTLTASATAVREVLGNRALRRVEAAWAIGTAADWAFLVVLLVVAYDEGGALAVGLLGGLRLLPGIVAAPFAPALVERFRGDGVLTGINVVRAAGAVATAAVVAADLPLAIVYTLAALVAGAGSLVRPIQTALLPALARTPGELVAANVASSTGEGIGTFVGPLVSGALISWTGSVPTSMLAAATFGVAAAAATGVRFEREDDARGGRAAPGGASSFRPVDAVRKLVRYRAATLVVGDFLAQIFVRGLLTTLLVVAAIELLDMGKAGVGLLNAALGLGGLVGALGALALVGGGRLPLVYALALAGWGLPLVALGAVPVAALALGLLFLTGVSNAVLDVAGFTLLQRGIRNEDRVAVFGLFEGLLGIALLLGSLAAPALAALVGTRGALMLAGALLPALALLTWRPIATRATSGALGGDLLSLLRSNPLFAPLPLTALDRLAEGLEPVSFEQGEVLMRKGERGDRYVLIATGEVDVVDEGVLLRTCGPGDGVGEIALVRSVARTATVTARTATSGYAIAAPVFLAALAGPAAAAAAERVVAQRLGLPDPDAQAR
ncbi:MAG TPA: MFS transporter [Gaiellaceae bacterium]|nr:MFS transporter [Gaiellaceae bacterium]